MTPGGRKGRGAGARLRVKVMTKIPRQLLRRQLPDAGPVWGECRFLLDPEARRYDWLVVIEDLPPRRGERFSLRVERLACPPEHTLLVTTEPSCVKAYGTAFARQFAAVLTSQEPWALPHPDRIYSQSGLVWLYGYDRDSGRVRTFDELLNAPPPPKHGGVSMVWSAKAQGHTFHRRRHALMRGLRERLPELALHGGGVRPLPDKAAAIDPYRCHVAIENHIAPHHWSEKLADTFLGFALPFYCGCPNVTDYFPEESLIRIPPDDAEEAARIIREAMAAGEHARRREAVLEARRRVLEEHNLFALLARAIAERHRSGRRADGSPLYARRALRWRRPWIAARDMGERLRARWRCRSGAASGGLGGRRA